MKDATLRLGGVIGFAVVCRCAVVLCHKPGKHLAKNRVGVFHPDLPVGLFEGNRDKVKESVNEGGVHVDDVIALLECHAVSDLDVGAIIGVGASTVVGYICNFRRKRVVHIGVCLATRVVAIEGGIDGNILEFIFLEMGDLYVWAHLHKY